MLRSRMSHVPVLGGVLACLAAAAPGRRGARQRGRARVGDPYFPLLGNGGYDVRHYDLSFSYDPATDRLDGTAVIQARATRSSRGSTSTCGSSTWTR